ncbi:hypothetical protein AYI68_g2245, partial [Smittium mucronatum]
MRMGTFRTVQRLSNMKFLDEKFKKNCPFCKIDVPEIFDHILLNCSRVLSLSHKSEIPCRGLGA